MALYREEMTTLVRDMTGASLIIPWGPLLRFGEGPEVAQNARPARMVHSDFGDESIHWMFEDFGHDTRKYRRISCLNIWRVLSDPPQDIPLAVCDVRTLPADDHVLTISVMDAPGQTPKRNLNITFKANPDHRWYYFKDMTPGEVLIFKSHDSEGEPRTPHTAFQDPSCPPGVPTRTSAEIRMLIGWE